MPQSNLGEQVLVDGRGPILLFVIFCVLFFDFTTLPQYLIPGNTYEYDKLKHLTITPQNRIILEEMPDNKKRQQMVLAARYTPFFFEKIPINSADQEMLSTVRGIGPNLAKEIIHFREQFGPLNNITDLTQLKGISQKRAVKFATEFNFSRTP